MPKANVFNMAGEKIGEIELSETIFGIARPARFHPSGFLSGADGAYSSLHSQFTLLCL